MQPIQEISADLSHMLEEYVHHETNIEKGSLLYREGELATELFIIRSGKVQISKLTQDGREFTLRLCSADDLIGEVSLACLNPKHKMNAKVLEDGKVAIIYMKDLENHLLTNNALAIELMKWMSNQNEITQTKIRDLVLNGKKGALYSTLIRLSNSYGTKTDDSSILINHSLTNQEIANFCGTSREVINRLLSDLRKLDVISVEKGTITIHDLNYLRTEISCENCPPHICTIE